MSGRAALPRAGGYLQCGDGRSYDKVLYSRRVILGFTMSLVKVQVWDATGNKRQDVQMPDDAPVNRLLVVLLEKLSFPMYAPDGQPLSYKLHHRSSGKQLLDDQTLNDIGVKEGDVLRLQPEITAG